MSSVEKMPLPHPAPKKRLSKDERHRQLLDVAWDVVRREGTDALTLGYLAQRAGVTKPVVYDHFGTRPGLLAALYQEFDVRHTAQMDEALQAAGKTLPAVARVIASAYVGCVLGMGREIPGVSAALAGSPELDALKKDHESVFLGKCRDALQPFARQPIGAAGLRVLLGAAEAVSYAAAAGELPPDEAESELFETILAMVKRQGRVA